MEGLLPSQPTDLGFISYVAESHGGVLGSGGGEGGGQAMLGRSQGIGRGPGCWLETSGWPPGETGKMQGGFGDDAQLSTRHASHLSHVPSRLKVTTANILQLQVQPSDEGQGLVVKIPLDMVAGLNT